MSIPNLSTLRHAIMRLIGEQLDFNIATREANRQLEPMFPRLTWDEAKAPYRSNGTRFGNSVQVAVNSLRNDGWLEKPEISGKGFWNFSKRGRARWNQAFPDGDELIGEMMA